MKKNIHSNVVALGLGFFLIALIVGVSFFRTRNIKETLDNAEVSSASAITENIHKATKISSKDLAAKIMYPQNDLILIDMRSSDDFSKEHLLNSHNVPFITISDAMVALDKNKPYVLIDYGPSVELTATVIKNMIGAGFNNISYLEGGFSTWKSNYNPIIFAGDPTSFVDQSKVTYIKTDQLKEMLQKDNTLALIDVRKKEQFDAGHLIGAINIFLDDIEKRKKEIPSNKKIIIYDNNGLAAFQAAVRLFDMGFFNTLTLSDGLNSWKSKNYEIVK
jgi:rhodanese-related sulfurtransferase